MGRIDGGQYLIRNLGPENYYLTLFNQNDVIKGALKNGSTKQKWIVNDLGNGTYYITNRGWDSEPSAYASPARGNNVKGSSDKKAWYITELNPDTYRISTANLAWSLESAGVQLAGFDIYNENQIFKFEPIA